MKLKVMILLLTLFLVSIYSLGYYRGHKAREKDLATSLEPSPSVALHLVDFSPFINKYAFGQDIYWVFNEYVKYEGINNLPDSNLWWISPNGYSLNVSEATGIQYVTSSCDAKFKVIAENFAKDIKPVMQKYGFTENTLNSSTSINDKKYYDYVEGYEKGNTKCIYKANPDCYSESDEKNMHYSFSFSCSDQYASDYQAQLPFLKDLELKDVTISIGKLQGDYALLSAHARRTGWMILARKVEGKWTSLYSGQGVVDCKILRDNQVPPEIQSGCMDL